MSKNLLVLAASAVLAISGGIGCNKSPEGGVTGTKNSFKVTAPTLPVTLKQGDKQTVTVTLDRESGFQQTVKLDAQAPKGLKADFDMKSVKASDAKDENTEADNSEKPAKPAKPDRSRDRKPRHNSHAARRGSL